jgi:outer membrane protein assembly factor BamD (BamD/ComL family)
MEPKRWELQDNRWKSVEQAPSTARNVQRDPQLDAIEQLIASRSYRSAAKDLIKWFRANKGSPEFDRGLFLMAEALYGYGDRFKSFYYLDELLEEYPESDYFTRALEKQYQIADSYLNGFKRRVLGVPLLYAQDEAVEMLFRIQARSPNSRIAERSLLRTADYYFSNKDYDFAVDAYGAYLKSYPRSPNVPQVKLRRAYSNLFQFKGRTFDPTPILDARQQFVELQHESPDLAQSEDVASLIARIDEALSGKLEYTAQFYQRTHQPKAASYVWRDLAQRYPNSPPADKARARIERLPAPDVLPTGNPTTQPISKVD